MFFTSQQYALMEKLSCGLYHYDLTAEEQEIFQYLYQQEIVQPKAYIADDYYELSEHGKRTLSIWKESVQREQAIEEEKLNQAIREKADKEADRDAEHRFQTRLTFRNTLLSAVLGAIFSNLDRLLPVVVENFSGFIEFIVKFFE